MRVRIRMYRQGLGDCFLLTFGDGAAAKHILIDCGTLGATTTDVRMADVARDIVSATGGRLDLLVATHEHKDHVSGFVTESDVFGDDDRLQVARVWQAWTENPHDALAQDLKKYDGDLITAARLAATALKANSLPRTAGRQAMAALGEDIDGVLAFADDIVLPAGLAKTVHEAMATVSGRAPCTFLTPGNAPRVEDWLPGVRIYVLGPPRDPAAIGRLGDHGAPDLYARAARHAADLAASARFAASDLPFAAYHAGLDADARRELLRVLPFDVRHRLEHDPAATDACAAYYAKADDWRRIDADWLAGAADLALQLDGRTNNTSLALAFELDDGSVLLFPGDAQLGNWLSWHEAVDDAGDPVRDADGQPLPRTWRIPGGGDGATVTTADLLKRTVFYKVGHHASHNATLNALGLELMAGGEDGAPDADGRRLTAMVPVDRAVALKKHPQSSWAMPARALYARLIAKTGGRVLRSDIGWAKRDDDFGDLFDDDHWEQFARAQQAAEADEEVCIKPLFVEWTRG